MMKLRHVLYVLFLLLLGTFFFGTASAGRTDGADGYIVTWKITEQEIDEKTMLDETFDRKEGTVAPELLEEKGQYGGKMWNLKGNRSPMPFCGFTYSNGFDYQMTFSIYRRGSTGKVYDYYYDRTENVIREESGFQTERAAETIARSEDLLKRLGLYGEYCEPKPLEFTTYGRLAGTTKSRRVVFEEILEGLPVRWSEKALYLKDKRTFGPATALFAEVTWSDEEGLLAAHGDWSTFTPLTRAESILSEEEAVEAFAGIGMEEPQPEACWFLDLTKKEATATLAWRVENTFLSAADGSWLQTQ